MAAVTICSDFGAPKYKIFHCLHCFPIYLPWGDGMDAMILVFWMLSFKTTFSLTSFTFFKMPFSSLLSAICVFEVIDISPGNLDSSLCFIQLAFCMIYSAYKLNKLGDNIQPWHTSFPIWNQSVLGLILSIASWPTYRFLRRQVRWYGIPIFKNFPVCCDPHSQRLCHSQ